MSKVDVAANIIENVELNFYTSSGSFLPFLNVHVQLYSFIHHKQLLLSSLFCIIMQKVIFFYLIIVYFWSFIDSFKFITID